MVNDPELNAETSLYDTFWYGNMALFDLMMEKV